MSGSIFQQIFKLGVSTVSKGFSESMGGGFFSDIASQGFSLLGKKLFQSKPEQKAAKPPRVARDPFSYHTGRVFRLSRGQSAAALLSMVHQGKRNS